MGDALVRDMENASRYPPVLKNQLPVDDVTKAVNRLAESFESMKEGGDKDKVEKILDDI